MSKKILFLGIILSWAFSSHALVLEELIDQEKLEGTLSGKKVGYYIGSFDPIHKGHEEVALSSIHHNLCDYIIIYPAWGEDSYKKRTPVSDRLDMLFSLFKDHPHIIVTCLNPQEMQKALTSDTEKKIKDKPLVKPKYDITFVGIIGSDVALDLPNDPRKEGAFMRGIQVPDKYKTNTIGGIMALPVNTFIVYIRKEDNLNNLNGKIGDRSFSEMTVDENANLSSTQIREAIQKNQSIDSMVSPSVKKIIQEKNLYR